MSARSLPLVPVQRPFCAARIAQLDARCVHRRAQACATFAGPHDTQSLTGRYTARAAILEPRETGRRWPGMSGLTARVAAAGASR